MHLPQHSVRSEHFRNRIASANLNAVLLSLAVLLAFSDLMFMAFPNQAQAGGGAVSLTISSTSFSGGGDIPKKYTCDGLDISPQLSWSEPPSGTQTFALLADDPDAPGRSWNRWTLWNLPATARSLPEGLAKEAQLPDGTRQGRNDFPRTGYNGPCPPPGTPHRYYFKIFALDTGLDLRAGAGKKDLEAAMKGHILAQGEWMGRYGR